MNMRRGAEILGKAALAGAIAFCVPACTAEGSSPNPSVPPAAELPQPGAPYQGEGRHGADPRTGPPSFTPLEKICEDTTISKVEVYTPPEKELEAIGWVEKNDDWCEEKGKPVNVVVWDKKIPADQPVTATQIGIKRIGYNN